MKTLRILFWAFWVTVSCVESNLAARAPKVKNIILLIGDGMGFSHISAVRYATVGPDSALTMDKMPVTGFVKTFSANRLITDSGASATALATGYKTNNGMISTTPDSQSLYTILMACRDHGMATGLVATSSVTHATPAAFASNVSSRNMENDIADQLLQNRINVLFGGGRCFFMPKSWNNSRRLDETNLIQMAKDAGYTVLGTADSMKNIRTEYVMGFYANESMTTHEPEPTLAEMSREAINNLKANKKGFFLMIEGSQIDWKSHDNDFENTKRLVYLFDNALREVLNFAEQDGKTLVVVTADHETGGLSVVGGKRNGENLEIHWNTGGHTADMVPLYAYGPGAEKFIGTMDNTDIPVTFAKLLKIKNFPKIL
ncbi:alkaline phosphatase [candidate division KSB1 bacterium]|nr:alkaline phosphatase [candidate division KSB1 bacterium]